MSPQIEYKRPYLDSSVYIAAINNEADRVEIARQILEAADRGDIQIVAGTWVAAEVIKMKGETEPLSLEKEGKIDAIFQNKRITWVELDLSLDPPIGDLFSTVRRDWHGVRLKEDSFEFFNGDGAPVIKPS